MRKFTPRVENVLSSADRLAAQWGHDYIGTEHLLIAPVRDRNGIASQVLQDLEVAEATAERLLSLMRSDEYNQPGGPV